VNSLKTAVRPLIRALAIIALIGGFGLRAAQAQHPSWLNSAVIYGVNPEIFSTSGLKGVTGQIPRLKKLGVNVIWLMPIYVRGRAVPGHPWFNSPYCIANYKDVDPSLGTLDDLATLISEAHKSGMKVILDAVCNHTSFDNGLIKTHPEYYVHKDGNSSDPATVANVIGLNDVAQLNFTNPATRRYLASMLGWWLKNYHVDGFRFDYADAPKGKDSRIPADFWVWLRPQLEQVKSDILMLGEEQSINLAMNPFELDYGWNDYGYGTLSALNHRLDATTLEYQWRWPYTINVTAPRGMMHLNLQDDWDLDRDVVVYGGAPQAMASAVYNLTADGVPLVYNGMEVGNTNGGVNSHVQIEWKGPNAGTFYPLYCELLALRNHSHGALQQGETRWLANTAPHDVSTYLRGAPGNQYLIEINTAAAPVNGNVSGLPSGNWVDVTPSATHGAHGHATPSRFSLPAYGFAIYHQGKYAS